MEIIKDEITKIEYVDFDDVLDEGIELDNLSRLLINGSIKEYLHSLIRKFITFNNVISELKYEDADSVFTHDEIVAYRAKFKDYYFDLKGEYEDAKEKDGIWKYIDNYNYTIEELYNASFPYENLQLSDIFDNGAFYKNIMNIKED